MTRKIIVTFIATIMMFVFVTATTIAKTKITYWGHTNTPTVNLYKVLMEKFEKENPEIEVINVPKPGGQYEQLLNIGMASGNTPDMFRVGTWNIKRYIEHGLVAPYDLKAFGTRNVKDVQERFMPGVLSDLMIKNGELYAIPEGFQTLMLILNMDMLKQIGITRANLPPTDTPNAYMDWIHLLQKLGVREKGVTKHSGFEWWYNHQLWNAQETNVVLRSYGAYLFDETGLSTGLDTPTALEALNYIYDTVHTWKICDPHYAITSGLGTGLETGYTASHTAGAFIKGLIDSAGKINDWTAVKWRTGPIDTVFNWAWLYGISPTSPHKEAVSKFIAFLARDDNGQLWAENIGDCKGLKNWPEWKVIKTTPILKKFFKLAPEGEYQDPMADFLAQSQVIMVMRQNIVQKGMNPRKARDIAVEELSKIKKRILAK